MCCCMLMIRIATDCIMQQRVNWYMPMPSTTMPLDSAPVRFSTWDLPERERLDRWREEFGRRIIGVEIEPRGSQVPFYAEATLQVLPGVRIASCTGSAARLNRTSALAAD